MERGSSFFAKLKKSSVNIQAEYKNDNKTYKLRICVDKGKVKQHENHKKYFGSIVFLFSPCF